MTELIHRHAASHKLYFDFGAEILDSGYEPYQRKMDDYLRAAGYLENQNWTTLKFPGAEHSEKSWQLQVEIPLEFLLTETPKPPNIGETLEV